MKKIIFFTVLITVLSCKTSRIITVQEKVKDSISTVVHNYKKDTLISIAGDKLSFNVPLNKLSKIPLVKSSNRIKAKVSIQDNQLKVDCVVDEYIKLLEYYEKLIKTFKVKTITTVKEKEIKYTPFFIKLLATIGGIVLLFLLLKIIIKNFKIL